MLSDITSSEGILARYSDICKEMKFEVYTSRKLHKLIEGHQGLSNEKVRNRHIQVMKTLDLIQFRRNKTYKLFTHGKTVVGFDEKSRSKKRCLSNKEKVLYVTLLSRKARKPILLCLENLNLGDLKSRQKIIIEFFGRAQEYDIWPKETIRKGLQIWDKNKHIHRSFENRFRCIEMWLEDMGLVIKRKGEVGITPKGIVLRKALQQSGLLALRQSIELISGKRIEVLDVNSSASYRLLKENILEKYNVLLEPTGFVDIQAMYEVVSIELGLERQIFFSKPDLPLLLNEFWQEDLISSLSKDTDGTLRYVVLKT